MNLSLKINPDFEHVRAEDCDEAVQEPTVPSAPSIAGHFQPLQIPRATQKGYARLGNTPETSWSSPSHPWELTGGKNPSTRPRTH